MLHLDTGSFPSDFGDLIDRPVSVINRATHTFDSDRDSVTDVTLSSGWNGPYITLGPGALSVVDGWGFDPDLSESSGNLTIKSFGSDGDTGGLEDGYRQDISVTILANEYLGTPVFRLYAIDDQTGSRIDPAPNRQPAISTAVLRVNSIGLTTVAVFEQFIVVNNAGPFEHRRSNTLAGKAAVRAVLWNDVDGDDFLDAGETVLKKVSFIIFGFKPRVETWIELELR